MASTVDTGHADMLMDFYGKRLATCSSDRVVKVFDNVGEKATLSAELKGCEPLPFETQADYAPHGGPVWEVAWGHPKFGNVLASCGYDGKVIVWRENGGQWDAEFEHCLHASSVNSIDWAPHQYGLMLACGSSDGTISILSFVNAWNYEAHAIGVNAVSWAPAANPAALISENGAGAAPKLRLASGGSDNLVKLWTVDTSSKKTESCTVLRFHKAWVRDVAWSSNVGLPYHSIASCDQSGRVYISTCGPNSDGTSSDDWSQYQLGDFSGVVWRVSWSVTGNMLAVSSSDNRVTLWKQSLEHEGHWKMVSEVEDGVSPSG